MCGDCHRVVTMWRESLASKNSKAAQSLANPADYENLFPGLQDSLKTEQFLTSQRRRVLPAANPASRPSLYVMCSILHFQLLLRWAELMRKIENLANLQLNVNNADKTRLKTQTVGSDV